MIIELQVHHREFEQLKSESGSLREEKVQFNETTESLARELQALKTELQDQGLTIPFPLHSLPTCLLQITRIRRS